MMQHQDGDGCGKCSLRKRQRRRIPLQNIAVCAWNSLEKPGGKCVVIFEARYSSGVFSQFLRCRARPCANFKHVFAQIRDGQKKRNYLLARHAPPVRRCTKPFLKPIHRNTSNPPREKVWRKSGATTYFPECDYRRPAQNLAIEEAREFSAVMKQIGRRCTPKDSRVAGRVR